MWTAEENSALKAIMRAGEQWARGNPKRLGMRNG